MPGIEGIPEEEMAARREAAGKIARNMDNIIKNCVERSGIKRGFSNPYGPTTTSINGECSVQKT